MIKKTLYFGNPAYLSLKNAQLVIKLPEVEKNDTLPELFKTQTQVTKPIEDIGVVVLDNQRITITTGAIEALLENNCAIITCDHRSMPLGLMLPLSGNTTQSERFRDQINASLPLKKQLWQQTIQAKINNQASVLSSCRRTEAGCLRAWARVRRVKTMLPEFGKVGIMTITDKQFGSMLLYHGQKTMPNFADGVQLELF